MVLIFVNGSAIVNYWLVWVWRVHCVQQPRTLMVVWRLYHSKGCHTQVSARGHVVLETSHRHSYFLARLTCVFEGTSRDPSNSLTQGTRQFLWAHHRAVRSQERRMQALLNEGHFCEFAAVDDSIGLSPWRTPCHGFLPESHEIPLLITN